LPRLLGINPSHSFSSATPPPPLDYTQLAAWAAHPDREAGKLTAHDAHAV
jgi:hypothetical protein